MRKTLSVAESTDGFLSFVMSMPVSYRGIFDEEAQRAHEAVVRRRGASATRVEMWRELPERIAALCIVADDRAGLLSRISAALVAHDMDVVAAQAYCRTRDDRMTEAVDFLWVRKLSPKGGSVPRVTAACVARLGETLDALVRGNAQGGSAARFARAIRGVPPATRVRFETAADSGSAMTVLTVETQDRPGLLLSLSRALFRERVQIVRSEVRTEGDGSSSHVVDRFYLTDLDGGRLRPARLFTLQTAVLAAVEAVQRDAIAGGDVHE